MIMKRPILENEKWEKVYKLIIFKNIWRNKVNFAVIYNHTYLEFMQYQPKYNLEWIGEILFKYITKSLDLWILFY